jgi:hypothetical protein
MNVFLLRLAERMLNEIFDTVGAYVDQYERTPVFNPIVLVRLRRALELVAEARQLIAGAIFG